MLFLNPLFPVFVLGTCMLAHLYRSPSIFVALLVDIAFMLLFLGPVQSAMLLGFALVGYSCLRVTSTARGRLLLTSALVLVLFIVLKKYDFLPAALRPEGLPVAVGLSYVLFRLLHLIIDRGQGSDTLPGLVPHLHYALHCRSLTSGPFQSYAEHTQLIAQPRTPQPVADVSRMATGFVKAAVIAPLVKLIPISVTPPLLAANAGAGGSDVLYLATLLLSAVAWLAFLYFNFSGYTDIVIAWARLCRLDLPENFDRPWLANNFLDFWARWHISMTGWFRTYLFTQLVLQFGRHFRGRSSLLLSGFAFFFTFLVIGIWHGPSWPFVVCGLFFGTGAFVNQVTRALLRGRQFQIPRALGASLTTLSAGATFCYVALAITPFWLAPDEYASLLRTLFSPAILLAFPLAAATVGCAAQALRGVLRLVPAGARQFRLDGPMSIAARFTLVAMFALSNPGALPDFVYKGF